MARYRICKNTEPHAPDWWTVEKLTFGFFWRKQKRFVHNPAWPMSSYFTTYFTSEEQARDWVREDRKPRTRVCRREK